MSLTPSQQEALQQLWAITSSDTSASRDRDERLLRENGWDVQVTVEQIFNMAATSSNTIPPPTGSGSSSSSSRTVEQMEVDDSDSLGLLSGRPTGRRRVSGSQTRRRTGSGSNGPAGAGGVGLELWRIISLPISLIWTVVGGVWYFFIRTFIPLSFLPHLPRYLLPPSSAPPTQPQNPTTTSRNFIRDLELLTGHTHTSGALPDFWVGSYRDFMTEVRKQGKVGLVILCCGEHEDDEEFKKEVLCDEEFVGCLRRNDLIVWGADIRSREGYQVSQTLLTTTYPSLSFVSLLPVPNSSTPRLSILTTLSGPPSTSTSSSTLIQTITTSILPRTSAYLTRLRRERHTLEEARHLREEQDKAFKEAEKKDREKAKKAQQLAELEKVKKERAEREEKEKVDLIEKRRAWRRYARRNLLQPSEGSIRVALRTPLNAERHIRQFNPSCTTEQLFIFAETLLIPKSDTPETDPSTPPTNFDPPNDFRIVTTYPRKEVERVQEGGEEVWELIKKAGGALVAEKIEGGVWCEAELRELRGDSDDEDLDEE